MLQFWPLALAPIASGLATLGVIALFIRLSRPGVKSESPHHRRNRANDLQVAEEDRGSK